MIREQNFLEFIDRGLVHADLHQRPHRTHLVEHLLRVPERVERCESDDIVGKDVEGHIVGAVCDWCVGFEGNVHLAEIHPHCVNLHAVEVGQLLEVHIGRDGVRLVEGDRAVYYHQVEIHRHVHPILLSFVPLFLLLRRVDDLVDGIIRPA